MSSAVSTPEVQAGVNSDKPALLRMPPALKRTRRPAGTVWLPALPLGLTRTAPSYTLTPTPSSCMLTVNCVPSACTAPIGVWTMKGRARPPASGAVAAYTRPARSQMARRVSVYRMSRRVPVSSVNVVPSANVSRRIWPVPLSRSACWVRQARYETGATAIRPSTRSAIRRRSG